MKLTIFALILLETILWRFTPPMIAFIGTAINLLAIIYLYKKINDYKGISIIIGIYCGILILIKPYEFLWPCDIACKNGAYYQNLYGIPMIYFGAISYFAFAMLAYLKDKRKEFDFLHNALALGLIGGSLYYCHLLVRLDMTCSHCLAIHTAIAWLIIGSMKSKLNIWVKILIPASAFLFTHFIYHPNLVLDRAIIKTPETNLSHSIINTITKINNGKSAGKINAKWKLDLMFSFECSHCADVIPKIIAALEAPIKNGNAFISFKHLHRPNEKPSIHRNINALSASYNDLYWSYLFAMTGSDNLSKKENIDKMKMSGIDDNEINKILKTSNILKKELSVYLNSEHNQVVKIIGDRKTPVIKLSNTEKTIIIDGETDTKAMIEAILKNIKE